MSAPRTGKYTFRFNPSTMIPLWHHYGGYMRPNLKRHGNKWGDAERRHLYAGYYIEGLGIDALVRRHERGQAGIIGALNYISTAGMEDKLVQQLHQHGEIVHNLTSPATKEVTLQPGEQLSVRPQPNLELTFNGDTLVGVEVL